MLQNLVTALYSLSGLIVLIAFIPQIINLFNDKTSSESMSLPTWCLFLVNSTVIVTYSLFVNGDSLFVLSAAVGWIGTTVVCGLVVRNRIIRPRLLARIRPTAEIIQFHQDMRHDVA